MVFRLPLTAIQFPMNVVATAIAAAIACNAKLWHLLASKVAQSFRPLHLGSKSEKLPFYCNAFLFTLVKCIQIALGFSNL